MRIAALIILYNPDIVLLKKNISACLPQAEHIYLWDNSEAASLDIRTLGVNCEKLSYHAYSGNKGIATALNDGCRTAFDEGFDWVLTLDQDSIMPDNMIASFTQIIQRDKQGQIGIITPQINAYAGANHRERQSVDELPKCITSGSLVRLSAFREVNGFKDYLFIDNVDTEFSLNLRLHGYRILRDNSAVLNHHIGNMRPVRLYNKTLFHVLNHNYLRCYYMTRNNLYIHKHFGHMPGTHDYGWNFVMKLFLKILFFEDDKRRKLISIYRGISDFRNGVYGKYRYTSE